LVDLSRLPELIGAFLDLLDKTGDRDWVLVAVQPHEGEKLEAFSRFAEDYTISTAYSFRIFDYSRFLPPFLRLKARNEALPDGSAVLRIGEEESLCLSVRGGEVSAGKAGENQGPEKADIKLESRDAAALLFSTLSPLASPLLRGSPFLRNILPLPLFFEEPDGI
jgi:hypothetical protein